MTGAQALLLGFAGLVLTTPAAPLVPALQSVWLKIHVSAAATASGLLLLAFVPAALFLVRSGYDADKRRFPYGFGRGLPASDTLERLAFRLHAFAFPIWTFAVLIAGPIWAYEAWSRYWGWDPKEVWALITWVVYAAYLHARATAGWRGRKAAWLALVGVATLWFNFVGINYFSSTSHRLMWLSWKGRGMRSQ